MYAVIVGAGEVGSYIASILSQEGHEIAVIDRSSAACERLAAELDVLVIEGNGASRKVLQEAHLARAAFFMAVTDSDEVNIISCLVAKKLGAPTSIARIRNTDYLDELAGEGGSLFGVDHVIQPETAAAEEIVRVALMPGAVDVESFASGQVMMVEVELDKDSALAGRNVGELGLPPGVLVTGVLRDGAATVPKGDFKLEANDRVFLIGEHSAVAKAARLVAGEKELPRQAMLLGGSEIALLVGRALEQSRVHLKVFEGEPERAAQVAAELGRSIVLHENDVSESILVREGVSEAGVFIAASKDDRKNILGALMAKQLGARRTIAVLETGEFSHLAESVGIDTAVSPRRLTASAVLRFVRAGRVLSAAMLDKAMGEVLEFVVEGESPIIGKRLADVRFPEQALVGAVVRGAQVFVPTGSSQLLPGDVAVVFSLPGAIKAVERLFSGPRRQ